MDSASKRGDGQVVIKLDARIFYLVVIILGLVAAFGVGVFVARQVGGGSRTAAPAQAQFNLPQQQVQPVQPGQPNPFAQLPPGQTGQTAKSPAKKDVPIGDNPRLSIPELEDKNFIWDFGQVKPDQKVEKDFEIVNPGTKDLLIDDVSSSCGCTAALVTDNKIPPNGKAQLRVTYDPRVNKDKGTFITRKVRIKSNDPAAPLAEFSITANVTNE